MLGPKNRQNSHAFFSDNFGDVTSGHVDFTEIQYLMCEYLQKGVT